VPLTPELLHHCASTTIRCCAALLLLLGLWVAVELLSSTLIVAGLGPLRALLLGALLGGCLAAPLVVWGWRTVGGFQPAHWLRQPLLNAASDCMTATSPALRAPHRLLLTAGALWSSVSLLAAVYLLGLALFAGF
jgi:hypothetical protein